MVTMAPVIVVSRARNLVRDLAIADDSLNRIDAALKKRVYVRLATAIGRLRADANKLYEKTQENPSDLPAIWAALRALRTDVDDLLEECLLLVMGSCARANNIDAGYCSIADALIDELVARTPVGHWSSFTVPGASEQYSRASRAIQVHFPAPT